MALEYIVATALTRATDKIIPIIVTMVRFLLNFKFLIVNLFSKSILSLTYDFTIFNFNNSIGHFRNF